MGLALMVIGQSMSDRNKLEGELFDEIRAMGDLLQMCGELLRAAGRMLSEGEHYAGSALARQVVEIEYLTWTIKEGHESVTDWRNSTHSERMEIFAPKQLRKNAKGRFLYKDYQDHCEQGGHPTPRGVHFLGGKNPDGAQIMLVDLITHGWRTVDQVFSWLLQFPPAKEFPVTPAFLEIKKRLAEWGERDALYAWFCPLDSAHFDHLIWLTPVGLF